MAAEIESIGLVMDTSGVERGIRSLDELAARGPKVEKSIRGIETAASDAGKGVSNLGASNAKGLDDVARAGDRAAQGLGKTSQAARSAVSSQQALAAAVAQFTNAERSYVQSLVDEAKQLSMNRSERAAYIAQSRGMSSAAQEIAAAVGKKIDAYKQEQAELAKTARASQDAAGSMASYAKAAATAFIGSAVVRGAKEATLAMFEASAAADRLRTMLNFATGGNSAREIEYLIRVTDQLGLQFSSTARAYGQFQAAAKGTALEGNAARAVFESVAKASAVMGLSAENTSGVLLALQQMISKGTVQAEELRGQLGERLPGAFQIAAKAMGVTTAELGKMLEQGQVIADDFLPKFAKALEANLGGAAEKAANRLDASVNRLDNAWERLKKNAGDSGFSQFVAGQYSVLADAMSNVSESIEDARLSGGGFAAQLLAGTGAIAEFLNPLNAISYTAQSSSEQLRLAEGRMVELQKAAAKGIDVQVQMGRLDVLIRTLREAKAARDDLAGAGDPATSGDEIRAARAAEEARRRAAVNADLDKYLNGDARQTKGQIRDEETTKAIAANAKLVQSVNERLQGEEKSLKLLQLRKALETEIANINEKHKDKTTGAAASLNDDIRAQVQGYRNADREILDGRKDFYAQLDLMSKTGRVSEMDAIRQSLAEEERVWAARKANFDAELAAAGKKKNSQAEVARITGEMQEAERDHAQKQVELTNKLTIADYKRAEAIKDVYLAQMQQDQADYAAADRERGEALNRALTLANDYGRAIDDNNRAVEFELGLMGQGERSRKIAIEQYRAQVRLNEEIAKIKKETNNAEDQAVAIAKAQAAYQRELGGIEQKVMLDEWKANTEEINRSLTDALMRGFEDGKGFIKNFRDALVNSFKTMILRPVISAVLSPVSAAISGALGTGAAVGGIASGAGTLSNLGSAGGMLSGLATIGGNFGAGLTTGVSQLMSGSILGGLELGGGLIGSGAIAGGLGTIAGVLGPIAIGAAALSSILGKFKGETRLGGQYGYSATDDRYYDANRDVYIDAKAGNVAFVSGPSGGEVGRAEVTKAIQGTIEGINGMLSGAGSGLSITGFQAGLETSGKGRGGVFAGGTLTGGVTFGESGIGNNYEGTLFETTSTQSPDAETAIKNFTSDMLQVTIQALQAATDLPKSIADKLKGVDAEALTDEAATALITTIQTQIAAVTQLRAAIDELPFQQLGEMSFDGIDTLIQKLGGLDNAASALSSYYENYYTEAERAANLTRVLTEKFGELGFALPATRDELRDLVDANIALGDAGAPTVAALLGLQGAFAQLVPAVEGAAAAVARSAADIASERDNLQRQIWSLQGDTGAIRAADLAKLDESNRPLQEQIWAMQDAKAAAEAAAAAQQAWESAVAAAAKAQADAAQAIRDQWQSIGDTLIDEIKRIRGEITDTGALGYAHLQSQFAITTAQARAGDEKAAEALPQLSQALLEMAKDNASSALSLKQMQLQIAASLEETLRYASQRGGFSIPAFASGGSHAGGWAMVGERGPELAYMPPARIYTAGQTAGMLDQSAVLEELRQLRADNRAQAGEIARLNLRMAKVLEKWDGDGTPPEREEAPV